MPCQATPALFNQDRHRTQLCFGAGNHRLNRNGLRNVRRHCDRPPTRGRNLNNQCLGRIRMRSIVHAYRGAALCQEPRRCSAEAAGAASHHRHLVAPFHHVPSSKAGSPCRPAGYSQRLSRRGARESSPGSRGLTRRRTETVIPCKSIACHTLLPPVHKEAAVACVRIVEDGEVSRCRQNPFRGLAINA